MAAREIRPTLQLLRVLDAMLADATQHHWGFELIKVTGLKSGTLYPILARLESAGWVQSGWEAEHVPGRPRRRYYRLTGDGAEAARRELANLPGRTAWTAGPRLRPAFGTLS